VPSSAPGAKFHVQQQYIEAVLARPLGQGGRVLGGLNGDEMALQQQLGRLKDIDLVIDDEDPGRTGDGFAIVSEYEQVFANLYASGHPSATRRRNPLKLLGSTLARKLR